MKRTVCLGEIMLRLAPQGYQRFSQAASLNSTFGGGEANVAVSLANYGLSASLVTRLPDNDIGKWCEMDLLKHRVDTSSIVWGGERMGIYFLETGAVNRASNVVYDRSNSSFSEIKPGMVSWEEVFKDAAWFHWTGITPAVSKSAALVCKEAVDAAHEMGLTVSCDLNYRKKLWNWGKTAGEVMPELVEKCNVIFGNEEDAHSVFGIKPDNDEYLQGDLSASSYESVVRQLYDMFPKSEKIVISLRGSINANHNTWAGILYNGNEMISSRKYDISHIVDRVGGGDSFMGGLICGLTELNSDKDALEFAVAASCLKHTVYGDFNLVTKDEVLKLMSGDVSGRVNR